MRPPPPARCDVAVAGAGPAGSALAALLARRGLSVVLLEKDVFPRDKLCGEFLSPEAQGLLARAGCLGEVLARGPARIAAARFFSARGGATSLALPGTALSLSRRALDGILFRNAARAGAVGCEGTAVGSIEPDGDGAGLRVSWRAGAAVGTLDAAVAVGAWGRRLSAAPGAFAAVKRHHRPRPGAAGAALARRLTGWVEVHLFDGGYCGLSFIEGGVVNVCALVTQRFLRALPGTRWEGVRAGLRQASPSLQRRLEALVPCQDGFLAVGGVGFTPRAPRAGPVPLVGDAAGMIAPLCGDGQAMALESAERFAALLARPPRSAEEREALLAGWSAAWKAAYARRLRLGAGLQRLLLRPRLGAAALAAARFLPALGPSLARATRGRDETAPDPQPIL